MCPLDVSMHWTVTMSIQNYANEMQMRYDPILQVYVYVDLEEAHNGLGSETSLCRTM